MIPQRGTWMALWTRSRQEKAVARHLEARRITCELPLVRRVREQGGRRRESLVPLFPGYVFMAGTDEDAWDCIATKRVVSVLPIPDQALFEREIEAIRAALARSGGVEPSPHAVVGRRCRVRGGPLDGLEGIITERLGPRRLIVQLSLLGQGASVDIDAGAVEPID